MSHVAVVLAAGQGTRMRSPLPKVAHEIAGRPMVVWVLDAVAATDPVRTVVVVGHGADVVRELLPEGVEPAVQASQRGTGDAVLVALDHLGGGPAAGEILVVPGDTPLVSGHTLGRILDRHRETRSELTMATTELDDPAGYGRVVRRPDGTVRAIVEHRDADETIRAIREVNAGMYVFDGASLRADLEGADTGNAQGEHYLTDAVAAVAARSGRIEAVLADPVEVAGVNTNGQLAEAAAVRRRRINEMWMEAGVRMVDPDTVYLDHDVVLAPSVELRPGVTLRAGTRVGEGTVLGPDVEATGATIGRGCRIRMAALDGVAVPDGAVLGPFEHRRG